VLTLGDPIIAGSVHGRAGQIGASIVVALLAVAAELGLSAVQRAVTPAGVKLERGGVSRLGTLKRRIQTVP
jgi:osmoprotectant transport system permease protein